MSIGENKVPDVGKINLPIIGKDHFRGLAKMVPLTLEQLREMDGDPVWIVESPDWGHWELSEDAEDYICDRDTDLYGLTYPDPDGKAGLHKLGWLAYAYQPSHIDREAWEPCEACISGHLDAVGFDGRVYLCGGIGKPPKNERFQFCPKCGRPRTEEDWAELEKRLRGLFYGNENS